MLEAADWLKLVGLIYTPVAAAIVWAMSMNTKLEVVESRLTYAVELLAKVDLRLERAEQRLSRLEEKIKGN